MEAAGKKWVFSQIMRRGNETEKEKQIPIVNIDVAKQCRKLIKELRNEGVSRRGDRGRPSLPRTALKTAETDGAKK